MFDITKLASVPGVVAVATCDADPFNFKFTGEESLRELTRASLGLLRHTTEPDIRLVVGPNTVIVQRMAELDGSGDAVVVAMTTGHAVAKSIHRTIRRVAHPKRGTAARASSGL